MAANAIPQRTGFGRSLIEAIRGTEQDFTEGSIGRGVVLLAAPMVVEMFMESLFAIVDVFWVTRLGSNAVATVGLTESMLSLVFAVAMGISMSATAMVARRIGEKDSAGAATAAVQAIALGIGIGVVLGVPGWLYAPRLLELMGASPEIVAGGSHYTAIVLGGNVAVMLLFLNNAIFRGAGDASIAMRVLAVSNLINIVLDPCLIFGWGPFPELGVTGAALATLIGRSSGVVWQFWVLARGTGRVRLRASNLRIVPPVLWSLLRVSVTGVLQFAIAHTSWVLLVRIISAFGGAAVAGYTIGIRIFVFAILPCWGLSGAAATMVGQNLGARKPERAERAVYMTGLYNSLFMAAVGVAFIAIPEVLVSWFTSERVVAAHAADCLRIVACGNLAYAFGMVMVQAFNGAGDTVTPTLVNLAGFWMLEIPLAWMLAFRAGLEVRGVFIAIPISELFVTLAGIALFRRGKWKHRKI